jgi:CIC family chloride channel protein
VLDRDEHLLGVVTYDDLQSASSDGSRQDLHVSDITHRDVMTVYPEDSLSKALLIMSEKELGRLPVVDPNDPTHLVGLLRREDIVRAYRQALQRKLESQHDRETVSLGRLTQTDVLQIPLESGMAAVGRHIRDLRLPPQVLIISIRREGEILIPHGETLLQTGDIVVALTHEEAESALRRTLAGGT